MVLVLCALGVQGEEIVWFDGLHPITYQMPKELEPVVMTAQEMWKDLALLPLKNQYEIPPTQP